MGQRTAFLIKRTYWNGDVNIRLVHHQWGIGRVMHNHFIKDFMEMVTDRSFQGKTLKDFMTIIDEKNSLYLEENYKKDSTDIPNIFAKRTIRKYFNQTDNNNGGMLIEIKEKPSETKPYCLEVDDLKISFVVGYEECDYDYDKHKYLGEKPFSTLYTGEEYVKISCDGQYAFPEFLDMWRGFIKQYEIEELTDTKEVKEVA